MYESHKAAMTAVGGVNGEENLCIGYECIAA